ncbi:MAG: quercetin dioxygenase-like cupin family protein [Cyclobacteriaceae bacterium]|jgi:quercetin dioxygenase-like cupin family protein
MKRILTTLSQKWPEYLLASLLLLTTSCGSGPSNASEIALPDPLAAGWLGASVCEVLEENSNIRLLKCTFPPGVGHEKHYHAPHVGYTVAGGTFRITDSVGTKEVNVPTGSSFSNESIIMHEVLNIGATTAQFLIIEYK